MTRPCALQVVTYDGRVVCSPKAAGMRQELLSAQMVSLSPDTLAAMDGPGGSSVRLFDTAQVRPRGRSGGGGRGTKSRGRAGLLRLQCRPVYM